MQAKVARSKKVAMTNRPNMTQWKHRRESRAVAEISLGGNFRVQSKSLRAKRSQDGSLIRRERQTPISQQEIQARNNPLVPDDGQCARGESVGASSP